MNVQTQRGVAVLQNLDAVGAGNFRQGSLDAEGKFQQAGAVAGWRGRWVSKVESGSVREGSLRGKVIRTVVGRERFDTIFSALRRNRETSLEHASRLLLQTMPRALQADVSGELAGALPSIMRARGDAEARFGKVRDAVLGIVKARQDAALARAQEDPNLLRDPDYRQQPAPADTGGGERAARRQAAEDAAVAALESKQSAPSGSASRLGAVTYGPQQGAGYVKSELPDQLSAHDKAPLNLNWEQQADVGLNAVEYGLTEYHDALRASQLSGQSPQDMAATAVRLHELLDQVEGSLRDSRAKLKAYAEPQLRVDDPEYNRKFLARALKPLDTLQFRIDEQRSLITDVSNNFGAAHAGGGQPGVSWHEAMLFKRMGLNVGANVGPGSRQAAPVEKTERFGAGAFNTVDQMTFKDGDTGIFKPGVAARSSNEVKAPVDRFGEMPLDQPRFGARNLASVAIDKLLGAGLLVDTQFYDKQGKLGILMEQAEGRLIYDIDQKNMDSKAMHRDLNRLQLLDAVTGQLDRHGGNVIARTDAQGNYQGLKGIDNDFSFGRNADFNDLSMFNNWPLEWVRENEMRNRNPYAFANSSGLPPMVDAELARKITAPDFREQAKASVAGLLDKPELDLMDDRIVQLQRHIGRLRAAGMTVSDWHSGRVDRGDDLADVIAHNKAHTNSDFLIPIPP